MQKMARAPTLTQDVRYDVSTHFSFGKNWADYASHITDKKIQLAQEDLIRLLPSSSLQDKKFLDIGCGSGLHALAALRSGCSLVTCLDFDPNSVETTEAVLQHFWSQENYKVVHGNILLPPTQIDIPTQWFDIVYSWGVLHHTGDMWSAVKNTAQFVKPEGILVLALYKKSPFCGFWKKEKAFYTRAPRLVKKLCDGLYTASYMLGLMATGQNPLTYMRTYETKRGMRFMNDVPDWLGGYPYESASSQEVEEFMKTLDFKLIASYNTEPVKVRGLFGSGCAEYVFIKSP